MYKIYLIESVPSIRDCIKKAMAHSCEIMVCNDVKNAVEEIVSYRPDLLVIDMSMPDMDGFSIVDHAYMLGIRPKVLASTAFLGGLLERRLIHYGAGMVLMRPFTMDCLVKAAGDILMNMDQEDQSIARRITNELLLTLGFRVDLQGYRYVLEAVLYTSDHMDCKISGELYPAVGKKCGASGVLVEKAIRDCITKAFLTRDDKIWNLYFSKDHNGRTRHVTSGVFIKRMAFAVNEYLAYENGRKMAK